VTVLVWVTRVEDSDGYLAQHPQEAAENLLRYVQENRLDGVNIDDEQMREVNAVAHAPNRPLVTRFFQILSQTFKRANPSYHLTYAAPPVISPSDRYGVSWLDMKGIAAAVDGIIPMGYTMNPPSIGWTANPEPLAGGGKSARTTTRDLQTMVRDYLAAMGGKKEKLLPGISLTFGGYEWRCRTDARLSPTIGKGVEKSLAECEEQARRHGKRWDKAQQSPWYSYQESDAFVQGWYNDPQAWKAKLDWLKAEGLGGVGIWVLDGVKDPPERWQALRAYRGVRPGAAKK
jgi:spore germination protein YaaH